MNYKLTYPEELTETQVLSFSSTQGWYARECYARLKENKPSRDDFERLGIYIKKVDLKLFIKIYNIFYLTFADGEFIAGSEKFKLKIKAEALGFDPLNFKNGDILNIENAGIDKGLMPILDNYE